MQILLVEDDLSLGEAVRARLLLDHHHVTWATTCSAANEELSMGNPDAVLLDLRLPDGGGLDLLRAMRRRGGRQAVIILTARDQITDRIAGLDAGADDYLVKPFDLDELVARLHAVTRRVLGDPQIMLLGGRVAIDRERRQVTVEGEGVILTQREWAILEVIARRPGHVVPKDRMEAALSSLGGEFESNALEVYVSRIRKKLGHGVIETLRGLGYRAQP